MTCTLKASIGKLLTEVGCPGNSNNFILYPTIVDTSCPVNSETWDRVRVVDLDGRWLSIWQVCHRLKFSKDPNTPGSCSSDEGEGGKLHIELP